MAISKFVNTAPSKGTEWGGTIKDLVQVDIEISGIPEWKDFWTQFPGALRRRAGHGVYYAAYGVFNASRDMVPYHSGDTWKSAKVDKETQKFGTSRVGAYTVTYDTQYAWLIHEATWMKFHQAGEEYPQKGGYVIAIPESDRGRQAKYLEKAAEEYQDRFPDFVGEQVKAWLSELQMKKAAFVAAGPKLVKKGTSSGGATVPVILYEPEPPAGGDEMSALRESESNRGTGGGSRTGKAKTTS